jgi:hypothetical protein
MMHGATTSNIQQSLYCRRVNIVDERKNYEAVAASNIIMLLPSFTRVYNWSFAIYFTTLRR